jgi:hypothetical protein
VDAGERPVGDERLQRPRRVQEEPVRGGHQRGDEGRGAAGGVEGRGGARGLGVAVGEGVPATAVAVDVHEPGEHPSRGLAAAFDDAFEPVAVDDEGPVDHAVGGDDPAHGREHDAVHRRSFQSIRRVSAHPGAA